MAVPGCWATRTGLLGPILVGLAGHDRHGGLSVAGRAVGPSGSHGRRAGAATARPRPPSGSPSASILGPDTDRAQQRAERESANPHRVGQQRRSLRRRRLEILQADDPGHRHPKATTAVAHCYQFKYQQDAQAAYLANLSDPYGLDGAAGPEQRRRPRLHRDCRTIRTGRSRRRRRLRAAAGQRGREERAGLSDHRLLRRHRERPAERDSAIDHDRHRAGQGAELAGLLRDLGRAVQRLAGGHVVAGRRTAGDDVDVDVVEPDPG